MIAHFHDNRLTFQPIGYTDPISLPVILSGSRDKANAWSWNGSVEKPTLRPSVRTIHEDYTISHFWLTDGVCIYLEDSTNGLAGMECPLNPIKKL